MDSHQLLQKKIAYQRLANKIKKYSGFIVIEIIDNQSKVVSKYENLYCKILKNSCPVYASQKYSKNFDENFEWLTTILPIQNNNEWILALSECYGWHIHLKIIDLRKTMYELWWNQNTSITLVDLSNKAVIDIGVLETNIDVRMISFSNN